MKELYFFIGTEAEIMKMYVVIRKAKTAGFTCHIVSSGQNDIHNSIFLKRCDSKVDVDLSIFAPDAKSGKAYLDWMLKTIRYGVRYFKKVRRNGVDAAMVVHGDTLSTLMGTIIARKSGIPYSHVEGGLRSYNWFNPFPEEIDRFFSSKHADVIFCPNERGTETARKYFKGDAVNTVYNTNIETLYDGLVENEAHPIARVWAGQYCVVAIHRQENLMNGTFMEKAVSEIVKLSEHMHCVFILHEQTDDALKKFGLKDKIIGSNGITVLNRLPYLQFLDAVYHAEFLVADGAGNQQEMYYLGKPYLILRDDIEDGSEGLNENAIGYDGNFELISDFYKVYEKYQRSMVRPEKFPSDIIVNKLVEVYG